MHQFHAILILLLAVCWLDCGCSRRKQPVPSFPDRRIHIVLETCEELLDGKNDAAKTTLKKLPEEDPFVLESSIELQRMEDAETLRTFLDAGDIEGLRNFLREKAISGLSDSNFLSENSLPNALQALHLFCQKMPWEESQALSMSLETLSPYLPLLRKSATFISFEQEQLKTLSRLKLQEEQIAQKKLLQNLEALLQQQENEIARQQALRFTAQYPEAAFSKVWELCRKGQLPQWSSQPELQQICLSVFLLQWNQLTADQKKTLKKQFPLSKESNSPLWNLLRSLL